MGCDDYVRMGFQDSAYLDGCAPDTAWSCIDGDSAVFTDLSQFKQLISCEPSLSDDCCFCEFEFFWLFHDVGPGYLNKLPVTSSRNQSHAIKQFFPKSASILPIMIIHLAHRLQPQVMLFFDLRIHWVFPLSLQQFSGVDPCRPHLHDHLVLFRFLFYGYRTVKGL